MRIIEIEEHSMEMDVINDLQKLSEATNPQEIYDLYCRISNRTEALVIERYTTVFRELDREATSRINTVRIETQGGM